MHFASASTTVRPILWPKSPTNRATTTTTTKRICCSTCRALFSPPRGIPAYTMEQMVTLNSNLQHEDYYEQLKVQSDLLLIIPGGDARTLVRNILTKLISPAVSKKIHCGGKSKLFLFKNSRIHGFLLGCNTRVGER
ncbi:unnamed protein product [Calicophoron daubneyi]|uniref:Uncharacterized protein n=1 Tax=Calicophoron daubneyi TaxID=300641 RepID=A0AAV2TR73_CALDB